MLLRLRGSAPPAPIDLSALLPFIDSPVSVCALSDNLDYNFGLHQFALCSNIPYATCITHTLNDDTYFDEYATVASQCYKAGSGVIAAATFAMLFSLLAIGALHTYTTFKHYCGCTCPMPRLFVFLFSLLSLGLYIAVVTIWWVKCQNNIPGLLFSDNNGGSQNPDMRSGYALVVAVICTVFAALGWIFATIRSFVAHGDDDGTTKTYGSSAPTSPANGNGSYAGAQSPNAEGYSNSSKEGQTFGY